MFDYQQRQQNREDKDFQTEKRWYNKDVNDSFHAHNDGSIPAIINHLLVEISFTSYPKRLKKLNKKLEYYEINYPEYLI